jgi:hypothetical protein
VRAAAISPTEGDHDCMACAYHSHEKVGGRVTRACVLAQAVGKAIALRSRFRQTLVAITLQAYVRRTCRRTQWCAAMHHCRVLLQRAAARLGYVKKCSAAHHLMVLLQRAAARRRYLLKWSRSLPLPLSRARALSLCLRACMRIFLRLMVSFQHTEP